MEDLKLKSWLVKQCSAMGITRPTPIQENCIPQILKGKDCVGCARTGSGKTLAFGLPILHTLSDDPYGIYGLVLTPTRELALQIADQFNVIGKPLNLKVCVVIGGKDMVMQGKDLATKPHIVVATPGRLADHLESCNTFTLKKIRYLVFDEADRMLDGSFEQQLSVIFDALPEKRQTLLFSATISNSFKHIKELSLNKDAFYWEEEGANEEDYQATVAQLEQRYILAPPHALDAYLVETVRTFRESDPEGLIIIFVKTCHTCQLLSMSLEKLGYPCAGLHSMKSQRDRTTALSNFRSFQVRILLATDVASRGLDIPEVQLVINHNVPTNSKDYVHRVGRTARAGRRGKAYTFVTPGDIQSLQAIENLIGKKLEEMQINDENVAKLHVKVGVTMREEEISLSELDFDERRNINKRKKLIMQGIDPDEFEMMRLKMKKERNKQIKKEKRSLGRQKMAKEKANIESSTKDEKKDKKKVKVTEKVAKVIKKKGNIKQS